MQAASKGNDRELYRQFAEANTRQSRKVHLRGLLRFKEATATAVPLEEVESAKDIVKRFCTGEPPVVLN